MMYYKLKQEEIEEIRKEYVGKKFAIKGDHPHNGKKIRIIEFKKISGCKRFGCLVTPISKKNSMEFIVFDLDELIPII